MKLAILVVLGLSLAGSLQAQIPQAKTPREEVSDYFTALNGRFWKRIRGFECTTGEETTEGTEACKHLLAQNEAVQDAWLQLALEATYDKKEIDNPWSAAKWARIAFDIEASALSRGDACDPRFLAAVKKREYLLLDAGRRQLQNRGRLHHGDLFVALRTWQAIPLLLEHVERDVLRGHVGVHAEWLSFLALRDPLALRPMKVDLRTFDGPALQAYLKDWQQWWQAHEKLTPAQTFLETARTWKIPTFRGGKLSMVRTLLEGEASLTDADLLAFFDADWPRAQGTNDGDDGAPPEKRIAWDWSFVRDAVLVISYKRQPKKTLTAVESGLKRNVRVYGDWFKLVDEPLDKDRLFQGWLPEQLQADLEARVRDKNSDPALCAKWLVLHDQFFPPRGKQVRFVSCEYSHVWSKNRGEPIWDIGQTVRGEGGSSSQLSLAELVKEMKKRGY